MHIDRAAIVAARPSFLGVEFDPINTEQVLELIRPLSRRADFCYIVTPNVDHVIRLAEASPSRARFAASYKAAAKVLCDSRVLSAIASWHRIVLPVVTGSDLTAALFKRGLGAEDRIAIIGGTAELIEELRSLYPHPTYFQHGPPMGLLNDEAALWKIVDFVAETKAHYVLFAVGAPQSEIAAHLCKESGRAAGVGLCIGASIEFLTGAKKRAPVWMQRRRLEWLYRLLSEPRRLGARYLLGAVKLFRLYYRWRKDSAGGNA
jgi:N-acetylglucosaminyldiphosphoundecaprenol N-acetyl-beta-D-mannosaminyltransferase